MFAAPIGRRRRQGRRRRTNCRPCRRPSRPTRRRTSRRCSNLTPAEAKKFWPIYDAYQRDLDMYNRKRNVALEGLIGSDKPVSDLYAKQLAERADRRRRRRDQGAAQDAEQADPGRLLPVRPRRPRAICRSNPGFARCSCTASPKNFRWSVAATSSPSGGSVDCCAANARYAPSRPAAPVRFGWTFCGVRVKSRRFPTKLGPALHAGPMCFGVFAHDASGSALRGHEPAPDQTHPACSGHPSATLHRPNPSVRNPVF